MGRTILDMKKGDKAIVIGFKSQEIESSFLTFGLLPNSIIELKRKAPFGGSLYILVKYNGMAIRRSEAEQVLIKDYE